MTVAKSAEEVELDTKINALSDSRYGAHDAATLKKLFLSYDKNGDNLLDKDEIYDLYTDADVGVKYVSRGIWVDKTFEKVDKNADDKLSWEEYLAASSIASGTPPTTTPGAPGTPAVVAPGYGEAEGCDPKTGICYHSEQGEGPSAVPVAIGAIAFGLVFATLKAR